MKFNKSNYHILLTLLLSLFAWHASFAAQELYEDMSKQAIEKRIKPVGQVYIEGEHKSEQPKESEVAIQPTEPKAVEIEPSGEQPSTVTKPVAKRIDGKVVYDKHCTICHAQGLAGAPKFADNAAWKERLKKDNDELVKNVISGYKMMPPKGACMQCTDEEIKAAVEYMVDTVKEDKQQ